MRVYSLSFTPCFDACNYSCQKYRHFTVTYLVVFLDIVVFLLVTSTDPQVSVYSKWPVILCLLRLNTELFG